MILSGRDDLEGDFRTCIEKISDQIRQSEALAPRYSVFANMLDVEEWLELTQTFLKGNGEMICRME